MAGRKLSKARQAMAARSRANGAKSKGPVTAAGKARSSRNAETHGLTAALLTDPQERQRLQARIDALVADLKPATLLEHAMVERIAIALFRIERVARMESQNFAESSRRFPGQSDGECLYHDARCRQRFGLLVRYDGYAHAQLWRSLRRLQDLRKNASQNEPRIDFSLYESEV
ncbi:MAG: hypothetical protein EA356_08070 [Geminicoccaceae bacterium]|nr:MAG: hypothetical protein EA356_08070 [Geminicoccaceae bacterium]